MNEVHTDPRLVVDQLHFLLGIYRQYEICVQIVGNNCMTFVLPAFAHNRKFDPLALSNLSE